MVSEKLNSAISENLASIINREVELPEDTIITISQVITTADLGLARVYINVMPEEKLKETIKVLYKKKGEMKQRLGEKLDIRRVPNLSFYSGDKIDCIDDNAREVEEILERLKRE